MKSRLITFLVVFNAIYPAITANAQVISVVEQNQSYPISIFELDIRKDRSKPKNWLGILTRDNTISGHTYLILGKDSPEKQLTEVSFHGFYPKEEIKFLYGVGKTVDDFESLKFTKDAEKLFFIIDDNAYDAAQKVIMDWSQKPPNFNLISNNCISFVQEVSRGAGIALPSRISTFSFTPAQYNTTIKKSLLSDHGIGTTDSKRIKALSNGIYIGSLKNNIGESFGVLNLNNGSTYEGQFKNDLFEGKGKLTFEDRVYNGSFKNGKEDGYGELLFLKTGDKIVGNFKRGMPDGKITKIHGQENAISTYTITNGLYTSDVTTNYGNGNKKTTKTDKFGVPQTSIFQVGKTGNINTTYDKGRSVKSWGYLDDSTQITIERYVITADDEYGFGSIRGKDFIYQGEIKDFQLNGVGELRRGNDLWRGNFKNGRLEGKNSTVIINGIHFIGEIYYSGDTSYQNGHVRYPNGDTYDGPMRNYKPHGMGTYKTTKITVTKILFIKRRNREETITTTRFTDGIGEPIRGGFQMSHIPPQSWFPEPGRYSIPPLEYPNHSISKFPDNKFNTDHLESWNLDPPPISFPNNPKNQTPKLNYKGNQYKSSISGSMILL